MSKLKNFQQIRTDTEHLYLYRADYETNDGTLQYEIASRKDEATMFDGSSLGCGTDAVCIIPFFDNGDILATREFRYAINDYCLEFPAGLIEKGESSADAAIRELKEETGLDTKKVLFVLPGGFSSAGMTDENVAIVGLSVTGSFHDVNGKEEIHSFRTTIPALWERVKKGESCSCRMQCFLLGTQLGIWKDRHSEPISGTI